MRFPPKTTTLATDYPNEPTPEGEKYPNNYKRVYPKAAYNNLKTLKYGPNTSTAGLQKSEFI